MIDRQLLRGEPELVHDASAAQNVEGVDISRVFDVYDEWRSLKIEGDDLRHERSEVSQQIGQLKQKGKNEEAQEAIDRLGELKEGLQELEARIGRLEAELNEALMELPDLPHESVPVGADENDSEEARRVGFDDLHESLDEVTPRYDLGEELDTIDEDRTTETTGPDFYFLKSGDAMFEHTLVQFILDVHREQEYIDLFPPIPVKTISTGSTDQLPRFAEDVYHIGGVETENYDDDDP